jgi:DNA-binding transcriptional ArsR family regulator
MARDDQESNGRRKKPDEESGQKRDTSPKGKRGHGGDRAGLIAAIAHPARRHILRLLIAAGEPRSPAQMAKALDLPLGMVAYHTRVLGRLGAVEPAGEQMVHGAVEHFYDTTIKDDPPIEALLEETREADAESE